MFTEELFEKVLIEPATSGANELQIISGYASAAMAFNHLSVLKERKLDVKLHLIVGMCPSIGLLLSNHAAFKQLRTEDFKNLFECSYVFEPPAVHSKIYIWSENGTPRAAFGGSANYTQNAFIGKQREFLTECDIGRSVDYFNGIEKESIFCAHPDVDKHIRVSNFQYYLRVKKDEDVQAELYTETPIKDELSGLEYVTLSLLDQKGNIHERSGLNWGQRLDRERNQAYIPIPASIYNTEVNIFPDIRVHFTVYTDDGKILICTRAQERGKSIHTPHNNSLIGEYFRNRLGLESGVFIMKEDLELYGRTTVDIYKIDEETFYMDFSVE